MKAFSGARMILVLLAWTGTVPAGPAVVDVPANPTYGPLVAGDGSACDGNSHGGRTSP